MKRFGLLALFLCLAPTLASAQQPPSGPPPGSAAMAPDPARFAAMQQFHLQMRQMHAQARNQILAALSAQHRTMVANVIGNVAIASNPDVAAAARQIDALLWPGEKQAVLNIDAAARSSMRNAMAAQRAQFEASLTAEQRAKMQQRDEQRQAGEAAHARGADAGTVVLHYLAHFGGPSEGMHRN